MPPSEAENVRAHNITAITREFSATDLGDTVPTVAELIDDVRRNLADSRARHFQVFLKHKRERHAVTQYFFKDGQLQKLDEILANIPEGFVLAPVLYKKAAEENKDLVYRQHKKTVLCRFFKHLSENYAGELRAMGLCATALRRMEAEKHPCDKEGRRYRVNCDHIIERGGAGPWALDKNPDERVAPSGAEIFHVNRFQNLMLLTESLHDLKNALNEMRGCQTLPAGAERWVVMMVPEEKRGHSGHVAHRQTGAHLSGGLFVVDEASDGVLRFVYAFLRLHRVLKSFNDLVEAVAEKTSPLQRAFALSMHQALWETVFDAVLRPCLRETRDRAEHLRTHLLLLDGNHDARRLLNHAFQLYLRRLRPAARHQRRRRNAGRH